MFPCSDHIALVLSTDVTLSTSLAGSEIYYRSMPARP